VSKRIIAMLVGALAIAIVAGCGGGDDDGDSGSLTKAEFIKQADAICANGDKTISADFEDFAEEKGIKDEPDKAQQEEAIVEVVAPAVQEQADEIKALGAPDGDEKQIEAMLTAVEEGVEDLEENPSQLTEGKNPLAKGSKLARDYGLEKCGEE
jgi:hypothetical protein